MYDLMNYKEARIKALLSENNKLQLRNEQLMTYIFELIDRDCPDEYKNVIKSEVFHNEE